MTLGQALERILSRLGISAPGPGPQLTRWLELRGLVDRFGERGCPAAEAPELLEQLGQAAVEAGLPYFTFRGRQLLQRAERLAGCCAARPSRKRIFES